MKKAIWIATCLVFAWPALSEEPKITIDDATKGNEKETMTEAVNLLSDCSGFFEFIARTFESDKKPATAEDMRARARGARMSAAYLLSLEYAATHKTPKTVGEFTVYVDGRAEINLNRMHALIEQKDAGAMKKEQNRCIAALPLQDKLVQEIRNLSADR